MSYKIDAHMLNENIENPEIKAFITPTSIKPNAESNRYLIFAFMACICLGIGSFIVGRLALVIGMNAGWLYFTGYLLIYFLHSIGNCIKLKK
jgi:hypothetical protein